MLTEKSDLLLVRECRLVQTILCFSYHAYCFVFVHSLKMAKHVGVVTYHELFVLYDLCLIVFNLLRIMIKVLNVVQINQHIYLRFHRYDKHSILLMYSLFSRCTECILNCDKLRSQFPTTQGNKFTINTCLQHFRDTA
jgi:hypothetical protein